MSFSTFRQCCWLTLALAVGTIIYFDHEPYCAPSVTLAELQSHMPAEVRVALAREEPRTPGWEKVEHTHIDREPQCQWCGGTLDRQVHHTRPFALNPALHGSTAPGGEFDDGKDGTGRDGNLITLCEAQGRLCHLIYGHERKFKGGENLNVRVDCDKHQAEMKTAGNWPMRPDTVPIQK